MENLFEPVTKHTLCSFVFNLRALQSPQRIGEEVKGSRKELEYMGFFVVVGQLPALGSGKSRVESLGGGRRL